MRDSFVKHPSFRHLLPWLEVQIYGRDGGPQKQRRRIELRGDAPQYIVVEALQVVSNCPQCGAPMHPFRVRKTAKRGRAVPRKLYFAAACPERPTEGQLVRWKQVVDNQRSTRASLRASLTEALGSVKTCCKGAAASDEYVAVIRAVEEP
jgi:hypothetical protein